MQKRIEDHLRDCVVDCGVSHTGLIKMLFDLIDEEMVSARYIAGQTSLAPEERGGGGLIIAVENTFVGPMETTAAIHGKQPLKLCEPQKAEPKT
jgi:hypothetical protein